MWRDKFVFLAREKTVWCKEHFGLCQSIEFLLSLRLIFEKIIIELTIMRKTILQGISCILFLSTILVGCIKKEVPNAEADILAVDVKGVNLLREVQISNNSVILQVNAWEDLSNLELTFTLTEGATISPLGDTPLSFSTPAKYVVTSEDGKWSKEYSLIIQSPNSLVTKYSFEAIRVHDDKYHVFSISDEDGKVLEWQSPNLGFLMGNPFAKPEEYPVCQSADGFEGKCAKLTTLSTGDLGAMFGMPLATGSLFMGNLDTGNLLGNPLASTQFGIPVDKKPLAITGYYKYQPGQKFTNKENKVVEGKQDIFDIYAIFYEVTDDVESLDGTNSLIHPNIISIARLSNPIPSEDWTRFEIEFKTVEGKAIDPAKLAKNGYNFSIVLSSSRDGAKFEGAVGSTLFVDELEVFFE